MSTVTFEAIANDPEIRALIEAADSNLDVLGFNEHGWRHVHHVAGAAAGTLVSLGYDGNLMELAKTAGLLHDIGNVISRRNHAATGTLLAHGILSRMGMPPAEIAIIIGAIGRHGDDYGYPGIPIDPVSAALIIADKTDVHRSRIRARDVSRLDLHDRVGFAVISSMTHITSAPNTITFELDIDTRIASANALRDLFKEQMAMCRVAAEFLACTFDLIITDIATD